MFLFSSIDLCIIYSTSYIWQSACLSFCKWYQIEVSRNLESSYSKQIIMDILTRNTNPKVKLPNPRIYSQASVSFDLILTQFLWAHTVSIMKQLNVFYWHFFSFLLWLLVHRAEFSSAVSNFFNLTKKELLCLFFNCTDIFLSKQLARRNHYPLWSICILRMQTMARKATLM